MKTKTTDILESIIDAMREINDRVSQLEDGNNSECCKCSNDLDAISNSVRQLAKEKMLIETMEQKNENE